MGTIRTPLSQIRTGALPSVNVGTGVPAAAFGAPIAEAGLKLGSELERINKEEKIKDDKMFVQQEYASFLDAKRDYLYGDNGLYNKQGQDAINIDKDLDNFYTQQAPTYMQNLKNPEQKQLWQKVMTDDKDADLNRIMVYRQDQLENARQNAFKSVISSKANEAIASMMPDAVDEARDFGFISIEEQLQGQDAKTIDQAKLEYMSKIHTGILARLLDNGQGEAARAYMKDNGDEILGSEKAKFEKEIRSGVISEQASRKGREIFDKFGVDNEKQARQFIDKNYQDTDLRDAIIKETEAIYSDERRYEAQAEEQAYESATQQIGDIFGANGSGSIAQAYAIADTMAKASKRSSLRNYANTVAKGVLSEGDQNIRDVKFQTIWDKIANREITDISQLNDEINGELPQKEANKLKTKFYSMRDNETTSFDGEQQAINEAKAMLKYKPSDKEAVKELGKFTSALSDYIGELEQAKGRKLTEKEKLDAGEDLMSMPYFMNLPGPLNVGSKKKFYEYDQEYIDEAIAALHKQYKPVTSGNILAMIGEILKTEDTTFRARFYHKPR